VAQRIINDAHPATVSARARAIPAGVGDSPPPVATCPRCRGTSARLRGVATLAMLAFLAIGQHARALDLTGGPTVSPPGGVTCTPSDLEPGGTGLTLTCTIGNPGAFADLYFGLANNATANGMEMNGMLPTGREIFRYASSTANSITYTSMTTVNDLLGSSARNVNSRLVLTLTSGTGIVIDTAGSPANNDQGDIQKLFRIAGNSFSVRLDVTSNTLGIPTFGGSNTNVFDQIHKPPMSGSTTTVNFGFYYNECTP